MAVKQSLSKSKDGNPLDHSNISYQHFKPNLVKANLVEFRLYDLHHMCVTLMLTAGTHVKVVAERQGHVSVMLALDAYSHCLPDIQSEASEKLNALIIDLSKKTPVTS
ncbi:hypothetical protein [Anoxynatronum sibiricum]|uniref:hypothetical protein n=1 Tax=Anoxynatronum sibiricum TaxID=210623 RepID=UPI0031B85744